MIARPYFRRVSISSQLTCPRPAHYRWPHAPPPYRSGFPKQSDEADSAGPPHPTVRVHKSPAP
jgi:hypothetical protein